MIRLSMRFVTTSGDIATISVRNAKEALEESAVNSLMDKIVAADVFDVKGGSIASKKDAKLIDTTEKPFEIA